MPYFRVDDAWWSHPKTQALSGEAQALWVRAGSWSMQHYTDGLVPDYVLSVLGAKPRLVKELVAVGYWTKVLPGHQFHDWSEYQETAEKLKDRRDKNKERMRAVRNSVRAHNEDTNDARADPVRDVIPSHPIPPTEVSEKSSVPETGEAGTEDVSELEQERVKRAAALRVDYRKVRSMLSTQAGQIVDGAIVMRVIVTVLDRAHSGKQDRTGLVLTAIRNDWAEWQKLIDEGVAA